MPNYTLFDALSEAGEAGQSCVLAIIIRSQGSVPRRAGTKMLIFPDGQLVGTIGGGEVESRVIAEAQKVLQAGDPIVLHYDLSDPQSGDPGVCGGQVDVYVEPIMPEATVLVIGCGHVGQALVELAHWLGFRVIACDDREDLCNPQTTPYADEYQVIPPDKITETITVHSRTYIAAVTRNVTIDVSMLPDLLATPAPYIGVIGSRKRWTTTIEQLKAGGIDEERLNSIHAPIGLELNAETPREIALSVMAEIVMLKGGGTGKSMKL
ncbi:MAG: XdhC family protein [Anaerolineae bacterium]|nr:XdhC family protein [Anaerolineae bacterium]